MSLGRLFLLFTIGPLVELALLIYVSDVLGWQTTLAIVVGTGLFGAWLVRREGLLAWRRIRRDLAEGRVPREALVDGLMVFAGGVLLITPGVLSDVLGVALVIPATRAVLRSALRHYWQRRVSLYSAYRTTADSPPRHDEIIDVRVIDVAPTKKR